MEDDHNPARVEVILPCLNEAAALPHVLARMPAGYQTRVVDNGSSDGTRRVAQDWGAAVIDCPRRGYGAACHAGLLAGTRPVVAVMDADGSLDASELPAVAAPVLAGTADLVVGRRRSAQRGAWPWWLRLANRELARRVNARTGLAIRDLGPVRVADRNALLELGIHDRRSGYPVETVVAAADANWRIAHVDVCYRRRIGRSKVTGTPVGALRALHDMQAVLNR